MGRIVTKHLPLFVKFMAAGGPALLVALLLNIALVRWVSLPKWVIYALVLIVQMAINFLACRHLVFRGADRVEWHHQIVPFVATMGGLRVVDWALYSTLVYFFPSYFVAVHVVSICTLALVRFVSARAIFHR